MVLGLAVLWQAADAPRPEPKDFRYVRLVTAPAATAGTASGAPARECAVLPGALFEHTPTLGDMRLFSEGHEVPYALTSSESATPTPESAAVMNAGVRGGHVVFDLQMPARTYSSVDLDVTGQDFVATATVSGLKDANDKPGTQLGTFTVFDLTGQRLGRSTTLPLAEASFPVLHVDLAVSGVSGRPAPELQVTGAQIPPSREAQTLYTTVAESSTVVQKGRESVVSFVLPAHVPVERVSVMMAAGDRTNFSRPLQVRAKPQRVPDGEQATIETVGGEISRVQMKVGAQEIKSESLSVPAVLGANGDSAAMVEVAVENGDDVPIRVAGVKLEMRQREICFDGAGAPAELYYGDAGLAAPVYDYARLFSPGDAARVAMIGPEDANAAFQVKVVHKSLTEAHPELLWVGLLVMVGALGVVAFRSAKKV